MSWQSRRHWCHVHPFWFAGVALPNEQGINTFRDLRRMEKGCLASLWTVFEAIHWDNQHLTRMTSTTIHNENSSFYVFGLPFSKRNSISHKPIWGHEVIIGSDFQKDPKGVLRELWRVEVEKDWDRTFKFEVEMGVSHKDHIYNVIAILQHVTSHNNTSIYLYHDDIHASSRLHSPCQKTCGGAECWPPRGFKKVMCYLFGGNWIFSCLGFT